MGYRRFFAWSNRGSRSRMSPPRDGAFMVSSTLSRQESAMTRVAGLPEPIEPTDQSGTAGTGDAPRAEQATPRNATGALGNIPRKPETTADTQGTRWANSAGTQRPAVDPFVVASERFMPPGRPGLSEILRLDRPRSDQCNPAELWRSIVTELGKTADPSLVARLREISEEGSLNVAFTMDGPPSDDERGKYPHSPEGSEPKLPAGASNAPPYIAPESSSDPDAAKRQQ